MNYWNIKTFGNIWRIFCASGIDRSSCVAQLVIGNYVNSPINSVFGNSAKQKWLKYNTLSTNGRISMNLYIENIIIDVVDHFWPGLAHWYRILSL